jgi:hypothetical protein
MRLALPMGLKHLAKVIHVTKDFADNVFRTNRDTLCLKVLLKRSI